MRLSVSVPGDAADIKSGTSLIWFRNVGRICGSSIGGATTFCTRPAGLCSVQAHKAVQCPKMSPPQLFGSFLALRANKNSAYVAPCLDTTGKRKAFVEELLSKEFNSDDWVAEVALLSTELDMEDTRTVMSARMAKEMVFSIRTPNAMSAGALKTEKDSMTGEDDDLIYSLQDYESLDILELSEQAKLEIGNSHTAGALESLADNLGDLRTLSVVVARHFASIQSGLLSHIKNLRLQIGFPNELVRKFTAPILWEAIADVCNLHTTVVTRVDSIEHETNLNAQSNGLVHKKILDTLVGYKNKFTDLINRVAKLESRGVGVKMEASEFEAGFQGLDFSVLHSPDRRAPTKMRPEMVRAHEETVEASNLSMMIRRLDNLETRVNNSLKDGLDGSVNSVSFGGHTFHSMKDMEVWVNQEMSDDHQTLPFGCFCDPYCVYQHIYEALIGKSYDARELQSQMSLKLTGDQMVMLAAFQQPVPAFFTGMKKVESLRTGGDNQKARFPHIKAFEQWEDSKRREGLRIQLNQILPSVRTALTTNIADRLHGHSEAKALAIEMLSRSIEFISSLSDFISDTYKEVEVATGEKSRAWDLVTYIVEQMFKDEFHIVPLPVRTGLDPHSPRQTGLKFLWGTLRTMELVEKFLQVGIANHQAISACYTKYMVTNSQVAEVKKLTSQVAEMEEERKTVMKSVVALEKKVANLQSTADKALSIANANGRARGSGSRE